MPKKRLKTLVFTGFSAFCSFLSVKLGSIAWHALSVKFFCIFIFDSWFTKKMLT